MRPRYQRISLREGDLGAGGLELGRHALAALAAPVAECDARALGNETPDRRLADPRCSARHRCNLAVEPTHVRRLSLHCETRLHDTPYPSGGHRLVGPAWVSDLNRLRKLQASAFGTLRWADSLRLGSRVAPRCWRSRVTAYGAIALLPNVPEKVPSPSDLPPFIIAPN